MEEKDEKADSDPKEKIVLFAGANSWYSVIDDCLKEFNVWLETSDVDSSRRTL